MLALCAAGVTKSLFIAEPNKIWLAIPPALKCLRNGGVMKYQNFETLKKNSEFKSVYQAKHSYANKYIIMYILQNGTDTNRLGVSVSKKVGNSIVRHRLARLIREAFRLNVTQVTPGYDVVVIARAGLKGKGYKETESAMLHLLKLHHIYNKEEKVHEESDH